MTFRTTLKKVHEEFDEKMYACPICKCGMLSKLEILQPMGHEYGEHKIIIYIHREHRNDEYETDKYFGCFEIWERTMA